MATNYVDYDYWVYGYGDGDLTAPELYVTAGYWDAGYCENEDLGSSASITATATVTAIGPVELYVQQGYWVAGYCQNEDISESASITGTATVTARAADFVLGSASITGNATVTALCVPDLYVVKGYWVAGYCENEPIEPSASITATATVVANGSKIFTGIASITGNAQLELTVVNVLVGTAAITGNAAVSAIGNYTVGGSASVTGNAAVNVIGTGVFDVPMSFSGNATVGVIGDIIGYEWSNVTARSSTWTDTGAGYVDYGYWDYGYTNADLIAPISNVWQQKSTAATSWTRQ